MNCKTTPSQTAPWGVWALKPSALLSCACILCPGLAAQKGPPPTGVDPFIAAIETIKQSVGSMDCLAVSGANAKILKRLGTAFLISEAADFLTAAHVVGAMQKADDPCPTAAITLAVTEWRPDAPTEQMLWFPFNAAAGSTTLLTWRYAGRVAICRRAYVPYIRLSRSSSRGTSSATARNSPLLDFRWRLAIR